MEVQERCHKVSPLIVRFTSVSASLLAPILYISMPPYLPYYRIVEDSQLIEDIFSR